MLDRWKGILSRPGQRHRVCILQTVPHGSRIVLVFQADRLQPDTRLMHMRIYSVLCISTAWRVRQRFLVFVSPLVRGLIINLHQIGPHTAYMV